MGIVEQIDLIKKIDKLRKERSEELDKVKRCIDDYNRRVRTLDYEIELYEQKLKEIGG